jgi:hypothetical protein
MTRFGMAWRGWATSLRFERRRDSRTSWPGGALHAHSESQKLTTSSSARTTSAGRWP